jgi:hypothetical protein
MSQVLMSDITVCIITNNNYGELKRCIFNIRKRFAAAQINVIDITSIPDPHVFPDGVNKYIISQPNIPEPMSKGLLLETVETSHILFISDNYNPSTITDIRNYATPKTKLLGYKLPAAPGILRNYPVFNTVSFPNPNKRITTGIHNVSTDNSRIRPTNRDEQLVKAAAVRKEKLKIEYKEPSNKDKHKLVGLWLDLKTNFIYKINENGTAAFCNVPKINVKSHRWRKTVGGDIEIINAEHSRFKVIVKNKNEIAIKRLGKTEFDFHRIGKNITERVLVRQKLK